MVVNKLSSHLLLDYTPQSLEKLEDDYYTGSKVTRSSPYYFNFNHILNVKKGVMQSIANQRLLLSYRGNLGPARDPYLSATYNILGERLCSFVEQSADNKFSLQGQEYKTCYDCNYIASCGGGYRFLDEQDFHLRCKSHMLFRRVILKSAIEDLLNKKILTMEEINEQGC